MVRRRWGRVAARMVVGDKYRMGAALNGSPENLARVDVHLGECPTVGHNEINRLLARVEKEDPEAFHALGADGAPDPVGGAGRVENPAPAVRGLCCGHARQLKGPDDTAGLRAREAHRDQLRDGSPGEPAKARIGRDNRACFVSGDNPGQRRDCRVIVRHVVGDGCHGGLDCPAGEIFHSSYGIFRKAPRLTDMTATDYQECLWCGFPIVSCEAHLSVHNERGTFCGRHCSDGHARNPTRDARGYPIARGAGTRVSNGGETSTAWAVFDNVDIAEELGEDRLGLAQGLTGWDSHYGGPGQRFWDSPGVVVGVFHTLVTQSGGLDI